MIMLSSIDFVIFIKTKFGLRNHVKFIHAQIPVPKWEKDENVGKLFLGFRLGQ